MMIDKKTALYSLCIVIIFCFLSVFQVSEFETIFVVRFGKIIRTVQTAGLHFKTPLIDEVVSFDKRILQVYLPDKEVIASDQKRLVLDVYTKYRIIDVQKFYESVRNETNANIKIASMLDSAMRQVVATYPLTSLLTTDRSSIMNKIQTILQTQTATLGVNIVDVRIIKADLPLENSDAIFKRMRTDRQKEARSLRSQGAEEAVGVRASADRQATQITSEATMQAEALKGKADADAMKIYSTVFAKDSEFYNFWKTLQAYKKVLPKQHIVITDKDNIFLKQFKGRGN